MFRKFGFRKIVFRKVGVSKIRVSKIRVSKNRTQFRKDVFRKAVFRKIVLRKGGTPLQPSGRIIDALFKFMYVLTKKGILITDIQGIGETL